MPTPKELVKNSISKNINERLEAFKSKRAVGFAKIFPAYPFIEKKRDELLIRLKLRRLEKVFSKITPHIIDIRKLVKDLEEQTRICACYLLFWKVMRRWETLILLARDGRNQEMLELLRSLHENLDLIMLFTMDKEEKNLKKWFEGEIIEAGKSREQYGEFLKVRLDTGEKFPAYDMKSFIYKLFSKYTHNSYPSVWDLIDPYTQEIDKNRTADYHWTRNNLDHLFIAMGTTISYLRGFYTFLAGNYNRSDELAKLDKLLPNITTKEEMEDSIKKFKT